MAADTRKSPGPRRDSGPTSTTDRHQPSVLGGDVATRSGTAETREEDEEKSPDD